MRIGLIRHFPVKKEFLKGRVKQSEVLHWFSEYNRALGEPMDVTDDYTWQKCYSSQLPRARQTAVAIYDGPIKYTDLLNEPVPFPLFKRDIKLPFLLWATVMRGAILLNHRSQHHRRAVIEQRAVRLLEEIINEEEKEVLIVSHAFVMEVLSRSLLSLGFRGKKLSRPQNGVLYIYEK
jgi:broad specificity phosphatase PhoE